MFERFLLRATCVRGFEPGTSHTILRLQSPRAAALPGFTCHVDNPKSAKRSTIKKQKRWALLLHRHDEKPGRRHQRNGQLVCPITRTCREKGIKSPARPERASCTVVFKRDVKQTYLRISHLFFVSQLILQPLHFVLQSVYPSHLRRGVLSRDAPLLFRDALSGHLPNLREEVEVERGA